MADCEQEPKKARLGEETTPPTVLRPSVDFNSSDEVSEDEEYICSAAQLEDEGFSRESEEEAGDGGEAPEETEEDGEDPAAGEAKQQPTQGTPWSQGHAAILLTKGTEAVQEMSRHFTPTVAAGIARIWPNSISGQLRQHMAGPQIPRCCKYETCDLFNKRPELIAHVESSLGKEAVLACKCKRMLCRLREGDQVRYGNKYGIVRRIVLGTKDGWQLHLQLLTQQIDLCKGVNHELIDTGNPGTSPSVLRLTREHQDIGWREFGQQWQQTQAGVLFPKAGVIYTPMKGPCDFLQVPEDAPKFSCCHCGCVDLWGTRHNAPACHLAAQRGEVSGQAFREGEWVWMAPAGSGCVDQCLELCRVLSSRTVDSSALTKVEQMVTVRKYVREDSIAGHIFKPSSVVTEVPATRLTTRPDTFDLPGVKVLREDGSEESGPDQGQPLPKAEILELFSGYGGLGLGLQESGVGETTMAVDMDAAALATLAGCHPGARTYEMDVCQFLQRVKDAEEGYPRPAQDAGELHLRRPDKLLGLCAGPPCQGFSRANKGSEMHKWEKNALVPVCLSAIETILPDFVVIENVTGLLSCAGMVDLIVLVLVSLGYQLRWRLVQCGSYAVATCRRRVIFLGVRLGLPMAHFPLPTHVFDAGHSALVLERGGTLREARQRAACSGVPVKLQKHVVAPNHAPLPRNSVRKSIGDLPLEAGCGAGAGAVEYASEPVSFFSAHARGGLQRVTDHVVWALEPATLERCALVPKEGQQPPAGQARWEGACEVTTNPYTPARATGEKQPEGLKRRRELKGKESEGVFGRLLWEGQFSTLLTNPNLNSDTTVSFIHPQADRPLTCREAARVQGIPDRVIFHGSVMQKHRQIGNSVPVPLGAALGRALKAALRRQAARGRG